MLIAATVDSCQYHIINSVKPTKNNIKSTWISIRLSVHRYKQSFRYKCTLNNSFSSVSISFSLELVCSFLWLWFSNTLVCEQRTNQVQNFLLHTLYTHTRYFHFNTNWAAQKIEILREKLVYSSHFLHVETPGTLLFSQLSLENRRIIRLHNIFMSQLSCVNETIYFHLFFFSVVCCNILSWQGIAMDATKASSKQASWEYKIK